MTPSDAIHLWMQTAGERAGAMPSLWERTARKSSTAPLRQDITTDVCVIGAGIAGVTTAYLAARENRGAAVSETGAVSSIEIPQRGSGGDRRFRRRNLYRNTRHLS